MRQLDIQWVVSKMTGFIVSLSQSWKSRWHVDAINLHYHWVLTNSSGQFRACPQKCHRLLAVTQLGRTWKTSTKISAEISQCSDIQCLRLRIRSLEKITRERQPHLLLICIIRRVTNLFISHAIRNRIIVVIVLALIWSTCVHRNEPAECSQLKEVSGAGRRWKGSNQGLFERRIIPSWNSWNYELDFKIDFKYPLRSCTFKSDLRKMRRLKMCKLMTLISE